MKRPTSRLALRPALLLLTLAFLLESCATATVPPVGLLPVPITPSAAAISPLPLGLPDLPSLQNATTAPSHVTSPRASSSAFQAGIALLLIGNDKNYQVEAQKLFDSLVYANVNSILLTIPIFMNGYYGTKLFTDPTKTPSDAELTWIITEAQSRGFSMILRPLIDEHTLYGSPPGGWRGGIRPTSVIAWFNSYDALLLHYAQLSQSLHVFALDIGSELDTMEVYSYEWPSTIRQMRRAYGGELTYSFNFEAQPRAWAGLLDFVSVDAWYNLSSLPNPSVAQIVEGWQAGLQDLLHRSALAGRPVVVTEVGAWPNPGIFAAPYGGSDQPYDPSVQQHYYRATCLALKPHISGIYWWEVELTNPLRPSNLSNYDPLSTPGTNYIIADCYGLPPKPLTPYQSRHYDLQESYAAAAPDPVATTPPPGK